MQNRYVGDIGDFGKLGLLRIIQASGLSVGVNWYLTPNENHNGDGQHVNYLWDERFRACDESLYLGLRRIVESGTREVAALQDKRILEAFFYSNPLDFSGRTKTERDAMRKEWHCKALQCMSRLDVVFVDPDNGLVVPSVAGKPKENKYVRLSELADYYSQGSSVIYYQHKARELDSYYSHQHQCLIQSPGFEDSIGLALKFKTTSQRYYFFIVQPRHKSRIEESVHRLLESAWSDHFCKV